MAISALATPTPKTFFPIYNHPLSSKPTSPFSTFCCSSNFSPDKEANKRNLSSVSTAKKCVFDVGVGFLAASILALSPLDADATRIEYYATVGDPLCEYNYARSGLGFCDLSVGTGVEAPYAELINIHYTARFADGTVFDSSYKRGRPLTLRVGVGKVIRGLDQGIFGGEGVPPMHVGGKRKLQIPPLLAYGPEPAGCFQVLLLVENGRAERFDVFLPLVHNSMDTNNHEIVFAGDCNIPANATLLYDINFVEIYSGNRSK